MILISLDRLLEELTRLLMSVELIGEEARQSEENRNLVGSREEGSSKGRLRLLEVTLLLTLEGKLVIWDLLRSGHPDWGLCW